MWPSLQCRRLCRFRGNPVRNILVRCIILIDVRLVLVVVLVEDSLIPVQETVCSRSLIELSSTIEKSWNPWERLFRDRCEDEVCAHWTTFVRLESRSHDLILYWLYLTFGWSISIIEYTRSCVLRYPLSKKEDSDKSENNQRGDDLSRDYISRDATDSRMGKKCCKKR